MLGFEFISYYRRLNDILLRGRENKWSPANSVLNKRVAERAMIKAIVPKDSQAQLALKTIKMRLIYSVSFFGGICPTLFSVLLIQITLSIHLMPHSPIICSLQDFETIRRGVFPIRSCCSAFKGLRSVFDFTGIFVEA